MHNTQDGFTLMELLVAIAILAILAALLFPVFARASNRARDVKCIHNMQQLCYAARMYAMDHDGAYPLQRKTATRWDERLDVRMAPYLAHGTPWIEMLPDGNVRIHETPGRRLWWQLMRCWRTQPGVTRWWDYDFDTTQNTLRHGHMPISFVTYGNVWGKPGHRGYAVGDHHFVDRRYGQTHHIWTVVDADDGLRRMVLP